MGRGEVVACLYVNEVVTSERNGAIQGVNRSMGEIAGTMILWNFGYLGLCVVNVEYGLNFSTFSGMVCNGLV